MQVTQVAAEGLKREFKVVVPAGEIESRVQSRLQNLVKTARVPGFRPGKVPLPLLKKQYGRALLSQILEEAVGEGSRQAIDENSLKPALQPRIEVTAFDEGKDLEFSMGVEVLPEVPPVDLEAISLTRLVAEPDEAQVDQAIGNLVRARTSYRPLETPRPAAEGDQVVIDFEGTIDGTPFEGGKGENVPLVLGSNSMVPGFETALVGAEVGSEREVQASFPESYPAAVVAGKAATFKVTVKEIRAPEALTVDDEWAKSLGFDEGLSELRKMFADRLAAEYRSVARSRLKRELLDHLAATYKFEVPPGMVEIEFQAIWKQVLEEMQNTGRTFAQDDQTEEQAQAEYRDIAERRVRLGLILADVGTKNEVKVEPQELQSAMIAQAQRFPGQERRVFEFFQKTPAAVEQLRAPIFEDKVVDFIIGRAKVEDRPVSVDELRRDPDEEAVPPPSVGAEALTEES